MSRIIKSALTLLLNDSNVSSVQIRCYSRWSHRKPLKVYTPEEYERIEERATTPKTAKPQVVPQLEEEIVHKPITGYKKIKWGLSEARSEESIKFNIKPKRRQEPLIATHQRRTVKKTTTDMLETVIDADGNFIYKKLPNSDPQVGIIITEIKSKKEKLKKDLILLEGKRLITDALLSGASLKYILFSRKDDVEDIKAVLPKTGAKLFKMPYTEMQLWSNLTTNPGLMGIFNIPDIENFQPKTTSLPITVICDNIREPGNLGALLRTCAGVGCSRILLTKGCANVWDTKVLRSGAGAHFKIKIQKNLEWDEIGKILGENTDVFIADNRVISTCTDEDTHLTEIVNSMPLIPYFGVDFKTAQHISLIVGGETCGISDSSYKIASELKGVRLNIPLDNDVDSLNVGAAIGVIAFEIKRQLLSKTV